MNVAILHFHLRRGGVTSVMFQQAAGLAASGIRAVFVAGTHPETPAPVPVYTVSGLDYDAFTGGGTGPEAETALASAIETALREAFPAGCDLLHVHNPLLRKNAKLVGALRLLQRRGLRLLIHEHDFAEDFRPDVYDEGPYPEGCVWAVVNPRDRANLITAGLPEDQVHYLPNPVAPAPFSPVQPEEPRTLALYPVRAIRRKNIGEAVLLSRFLPKTATLAVTLPPTSPSDLPLYNEWKHFAAEAGDTVTFEAGLAASLDDLFKRTSCAVTTSVKEGFGYSYLDPLVRGLPVAGRAAVAARSVFDEAGLVFDGLYSSIAVPREALSVAHLDTAVDERLSNLRTVFAAVPGWKTMEERLRSRFMQPYLDFGALDERLQKEVLGGFGDKGFIREVVGLNPFLNELFTPRSEADSLRLREAVLNRFSSRDYQGRLVALYQKAMGSSTGAVDKNRLAQAFLDPEAFFLTAS